jgi:hypothetical protein
MKYKQCLIQNTTPGKYPNALYQELFEKEFNCKIISDIANPTKSEYNLRFNTNKDMTAFLLRFA